MGTPAITLTPGGGFLLEATGSATIFTPEMLNDEQRMMKKTADDFMKGEVLPRLAEGTLGRERNKCDYAKRATVYAASLGVQKYMTQIQDKQELLGGLADCMILTFGMDSAITRTMQMIASQGEEKSRIAVCMTQLFVAKAHEEVFDLIREMLMWMSQEEEWGREVRDVNTYYTLDRVNTFSLRRKIALHTLENGGYAL